MIATGLLAAHEEAEEYGKMENIKRFCDSFLELGLPGFDLVVYKEGNASTEKAGL